MHLIRPAIAAALLLTLAGCLGNSEAAKQKALQNGDNYLKEGKLREASIIYRNILKKDAKYGPAYARLGDVELRRGRPVEAVRALLRAVELLPKDEEVAGKLADIYLIAYSTDKTKNERLLRDVEALRDTLLKNNPQSYHGMRLAGFVDVAKGDLLKAEERFRKADSLKPKQPELRFALTQVLVQLGKWDESRQLSQEIMQDSPNYRPVYDFLVLNYLRRGMRAEAEGILKKKTEVFSSDVDAPIQLAAYYQSTQRPGEAEKVLTGILADPKRYPEGRLKVGDFYGRIQQTDRALSILEEGIKIDPARKTQYRLRMVSIYTALRRMEDAVRVAEAAVQEDSKNNDALSMRAALYLMSGNQEKQQKAITDLQELLSRTPDNLVVRYNLARAYHMRGDYDAARVQYEQATKLRKDFLAAWLGLGEVLLIKKDYGKAIAAADEVLGFSGNNLGAKVIKINALISSGNLRQARTELTEYLKQHPDSPDLQFQSALIYMSERRMPEAERLLMPLRTRFPSDIRVLFSLAEIYLNSNRGPEAMRMLQSEKTQHPERADIRAALGNTAIRLAQYDIAEKEFRELTTMEPSNHLHFMKLGEVLRRKGNNQDAVEIMRKAQQLSPSDVTANLQLALTLESVGKRNESQPFYENVLRAQPDNPIALNNLAYMMAESGGNLDTALTYAQRARAQMPQNPDVADTLGWIYLKKNLNDPALDIFKELTAKNPGNALYHYHLGLAQFQKKDLQSAKKALQTALALKPDRENESKIRELLAKIG
jgi:tetratricopeptide (TPR) repeat protein